MNRTFLHVDMDAFFAAVEQHDHPELQGKPVVVGARPDQRGVVAAASYEAREYGVHSAMPSREAGRKCPHAVFVPVNGKRYREVSRQLFAIFRRFTPFVEPLSVDEAFLDVSGAKRLLGSGVEIARRIKQCTRDECGLTASVGVAPNKFLAKLASDLEKPDGLTVVPRDPVGIRGFLSEMGVGRIWGVGTVTRSLLESAGFRTFGDIQNASEERVAAAVGKRSAKILLRLACGEDSRDIELEHEEKSISHEYTFPEDCTSAEQVQKMLCDLVEEVGCRLRAAGRYAARAHLKLRWQGFQTITRRRSLARPACDDFTLRSAALAMLANEELARPVRLVGFGVSGLGSTSGQMTLFAAEDERVCKQERLSRAMDDLRSQFGREAVRSGAVEKKKGQRDEG